MATPALRAIRRRFSKARIAFLAEPNLRDLIRGGDWMDEVVDWPARTRRQPWHREYRQLTRQLRARKLDWAILLPNSARSALVVLLGKATRRIGYNRDSRGLLLTDRLPVRNRQGRKFTPLPIVEYYADLVEALDCERPDDRLELFTTEDCDDFVETQLSERGWQDHRPLVVLSPGAKYGAAKCWFPERFAAVADRLIDKRNAAVVVTCGPGEESIAQKISDEMHGEALVPDPHRLGLGGLKSLIRRADLLICNDAGPRHFAKAFDIPVVTIFGPTHPEWTATSYVAERIVRIDIDCGPCQQRICPLGHLDCMKGVTVDDVHSASIELLDHASIGTMSHRAGP